MKSISEGIKLFEFTGKSSANNSKQYRKLIQEHSERSYNQYILFKIAAAACHESGFWRVHLSAWLPQARSALNTLFYDINISQGSAATRLKSGGIFNDCFIANFLENVTVKEFWKSASIWRSCRLCMLTFFGPPCIRQWRIQVPGFTAYTPPTTQESGGLAVQIMKIAGFGDIFGSEQVWGNKGHAPKMLDAGTSLKTVEQRTILWLCNVQHKRASTKVCAHDVSRIPYLRQFRIYELRLWRTISMENSWLILSHGSATQMLQKINQTKSL